MIVQTRAEFIQNWDTTVIKRMKSLFYKRKLEGSLFSPGGQAASTTFDEGGSL